MCKIFQYKNDHNSFKINVSTNRYIDNMIISKKSYLMVKFLEQFSELSLDKV